MCYLGLSPQPPPSSLRQFFYICTTPDSIAVSQFTKDGNAICISANIYLKPLPPQGLAGSQKGQGSRSTPLGSSDPSGERTIWIRVWSKYKSETFEIEAGCVFGSIVCPWKLRGDVFLDPWCPCRERIYGETGAGLCSAVLQANSWDDHWPGIWKQDSRGAFRNPEYLCGAKWAAYICSL